MATVTPTESAHVPLALVHDRQEASELPFHPLANVFPLIEGAEFDELVASIREVGQLERIVIFENAILDGRNRYRACKAAGVEPRIEEFRGADPIKFVAAKNVDRRHLTSTQRALAALDIYKLRENGWNGPGHLLGTDASVPSDGAVVRNDIAELFSVSPDLLTCVRTVLDRGLPDEVDALRSGKVNGKAAHTRLRNREKGLENPPLQADRHQKTHQVHADIWANFRAALDGLTSLPQPSDVVAVIRGNTARRKVTGEKFDRALDWLMRFSDAWENAK